MISLMVRAIILLLVIALFIPSCHAQAVKLGFSDFNSVKNWEETQSYSAIFLREAVGGSLVSLKADGSFRPELAASVTVNRDLLEWEFSLKTGAQFATGQVIKLTDIVFSLERCKGKGTLPGLSEVKTVDRKTAYGSISYSPVSYGLERHAQAILNSDSLKKERKGFPEKLAACKIYPESVVKGFGDEYGKGTAYISSGHYELVRVVKGRRVELKRVKSLTSRVVVPELLEIGLIKSAKAALTGLRMGNLDGFLTDDKVVIKLVDRDDTLSRRDCLDSVFISRKGFKLNCHKNYLRLDSFGYINE